MSVSMNYLQHTMQKNALFTYLEGLVYKRHDGEFISILHANPSTINVVDSTGQTLLFAATKFNNFLIMEHLIRAGCDVNDKDVFGWTPLMLAAKSADTRLAEMLIHHGADMFIENSSGQSALDIYLSLYDSKQPPRLLRRFFDKANQSNISLNNLLEKLIKAKCPLDAIVHFRHAELTKIFLERRQDVENNERDYSLINCIVFRLVENFKVLLQYGPKVDLRRMIYLSCLKKFASQSQTSKEVLERLEGFIQVLSDLRFLDEDTVDILNDWFLEATEERLQIILKYDLNSYVKEEFGYEPIAYIFGNPNPGILKLIQKEKIDLNVRGRKGHTPLHIAVHYEIDDHIYYLLKNGVDPNITSDYGVTPTFYAINRDSKYLTLLLKYHADLQVCDNEGRTCLDYAEFTDNFVNTLVIILNHLALLRTREVKLKDELINFIFSDNRIISFYESRCDQLEEMKTHKLCETLTVYMALTESVEFLSHRVRSLNFYPTNKKQFFKKYDLVRYDDYYTYEIVNRIFTAYSIRKSRDRALIVISNCISTLKPYHLVIKHICKYLTRDELRKIAYPLSKSR